MRDRTITLPVADEPGLAAAARALLVDFVEYARAVSELNITDESAQALIDSYLAGDDTDG